MDIFLSALANIIDPTTLLFMVVGVGAGLMAGSIPGFTIAMAVVLTLPFTFSMPPAQGLATMISVLVGGLSGGLMSGILTGIPGTPSSVATTFDGFPMARRGGAGLALGIGVWSSFCGGIISAALLVLFAPQLAAVGLEFQPWDFFMLVMFALTVTASLAGEHLIKGLIAGAAGLLIRTVGEDDAVGVGRFDFGSDYLLTGFDVIRSALIGMFTGTLPGAGGSIANILSYDQAKKAAKDDSQFGKGDPRGIIAPEASNNAVEGEALTPLMALGIPGDITAAIMLGAIMLGAIMLGALLMHDIVPGPAFISDEPVLAYSIYIAFFLASFIMLGMQPIVLRVFVLVTRINAYVLATVILNFATIGVFALHNSVEDIWTLFFFGLLGFTMRQYGFPLAPMILGVVLGDIAELNLARALAINSDPMLFITRPWSLFFVSIAVFSTVFPLFQKQRGSGSMLEKLYSPMLLLALSAPLFMMGGVFRTSFAVLAILGSGYILMRHRAKKARSAD